MRILVACECSGAVRNAFRAIGHDAWSCDLMPAEDASPFHYRCDVRQVLGMGWDKMIAHPPCDYLTVSGNRWFSDAAIAGPGVLTGSERRRAQADSVEFVKLLWSASIDQIAIENPIGRLSTLWKKPDQTIQPWQFWTGKPGSGEVKATCLWLKNLPPLEPTTPYEIGRYPACWLESPGPQRKANRSRTYPGISAAMADQWGKSLTTQMQLI